MPKTNYFVTDANGVKHTRSSDRVYTHAVVSKGDYAKHIAQANAQDWNKSERSNFKYYVSIAEGRDPYPSKPWDRVAYAWANKSEEWIAEHDARMEANNAERVVDAKARVEGHTVESYCEGERLARIARIEQAKAEGHYDKFFCAGFTGRLDLAQKLAAKTPGIEVTILPVEIEVKAPRKGKGA